MPTRFQRIAGYCERHALLLWTLAALVTRLPLMAVVDLSLDEAVSWYVTHKALSGLGFIKALSVAIDPPLYVAINLAFAKAFGLSLVSLRFPPVLFGIATVPLTCLLFRRLLPARQAAAVTGLVLMSPFLIHHAMTARPYSQLLFFSLLFTYAFYVSRSMPLLKRRVLLCACTALTIASHYYALLHFAAFYAVVLVGHFLRARRPLLKEDFATGVWTLLFSSPLLILPLRQVGVASIPYWEFSNINLTVVLSEQLWFVGLQLLSKSFWITLISGLIVALWALPVYWRWRRGQLPQLEPTIWVLGWLPLLVMWLFSLVLGRSIVYYPRAYIASTPFLFAVWVACTAGLPWKRWARRSYLTSVLLPFVYIGSFYALSDPRQAHLRGRDITAQMIAQAEDHSSEYDLLLIHHHWLGAYFMYRFKEREKLVLLGEAGSLEGKQDPTQAALDELRTIPGSTRVMLALNDVATKLTDRHGLVLGALLRERKLLGEIPCHPELQPGLGVLCSRMFMFGPKESPAQGAVPTEAP